nr:protein regulator of cytokinesis 1-like [Pelodiscus sinensis]|eukprot:XP_025045293.1 protein regulator of cytokinesis 1-like [Pelodiscus sinensis]
MCYQSPSFLSEVLAAESVACLNKALGHLRDIWEEIGIPEEQRLQRTEVVKKHIKGLLDMMVAEEESLKERLLKSIALCRKELDTLCKELQLDPFEVGCRACPWDSLLSVQPGAVHRAPACWQAVSPGLSPESSSASWGELSPGLPQMIQDMGLTACSRGELGVLLVRIARPFHSASQSTWPPWPLALRAFHLQGRRREEFVSIKRQIILCMEELEHVPDTSFERDVVCEDEDAFCLSLENIAALRALLQQLEARRAVNEAACGGGRVRVVALWGRLQGGLEELKLQNMKRVMAAIRAELAAYWDMCFYGPEQRRAFAPYCEEDCTEALLQLHEAEVGRVKRYYEMHKELFEAVQKWEENWRLFLELERKATDPSRFANRGGNLLREEKQRAKLQKTLPKVGAGVGGGAWQGKQAARPRGLSSWRLQRLEKEREKQERELKKSRQIEEEMLYGSAPRTPSKRRGLGANTPGKVRKVNGPRSPSAGSRSPFGGALFHSPVARPPPSGGKPGQPARTPARVARKPLLSAHAERNKENVSQLNGTALSGGCTPAAPAQRTCSINSVASTYSEFARELSKASRSDSSVRILNSTSTNLHC